MEFGLRLVIASVEVDTVNVAAADLAPLGLATVTITGPADVSKVAFTVAPTSEGLENVVASATFPHITVELGEKFAPITLSTNPVLPTAVELGLRLDIDGPPVTVNVAAPDVAPPGFVTVILVAPPLVKRLPGTLAVNCAPPMKLVTSVVLPHLTTAPETKPAPFTVNGNPAPPIAAEFGLRDVIEGDGEVTVKVAAADVAPPGFATVMLAGPALATSPAVTLAVN
jgi:hypothetical protein